MITTREPWFNHLREDKTVSTPDQKTQQDVDRDLGRRYPQHPVQVMKDPIVLSMMTVHMN